MSYHVHNHGLDLKLVDPLIIIRLHSDENKIAVEKTRNMVHHKNIPATFKRKGPNIVLNIKQFYNVRHINKAIRGPRYENIC